MAKIDSSDSSASSPGSGQNEELDRNNDEEIDIDLLIAEVKRRPPLFTKALEELERETRQELWIEVCQAIFKQWNDFDPAKKKEKEKDVQTKWRSLRDTFYKKFGGAQTLTTPGKKKRKYYYLNSLSFLIPTMAEQDGTIQDNNNEPEIVFETGDVPRRKIPDINNVMPSISAQSMPIYEQQWQFPELKPSEVTTPKVTQEKDDIDENTHFALMLVPMMRKLNDDQRYHARVSILRCMRQASLMGQEKIAILQEELKYPDPGDSNLMQDLNYSMPEEATFDDGQEYPAPAPIVSGRPTNPDGEIQYPETDPEDV